MAKPDTAARRRLRLHVRQTAGLPPRSSCSRPCSRRSTGRRHALRAIFADWSALRRSSSCRRSTASARLRGTANKQTCHVTPWNCRFHGAAGCGAYPRGRARGMSRNFSAFVLTNQILDNFLLGPNLDAFLAVNGRFAPKSCRSSDWPAANRIWGD